MTENLSEQYWQKIYETKDLNIFDNPICNNCRKENLEKKRHMGYPVPLNYIGKNFPTDDFKILYIGKESYEGNEIKTSENVDSYDHFPYERTKDLYFNLDEKDHYSHFWGWTKEISEKILNKGDDSFHYIAWSNLMKCKIGNDDLEDSSCNLVGNRDKYCIQEAKWIYREIEQLKPKNIIVFAGVANNYRLAKLFLGDENLITEIDAGDNPSDRNLLFTHLKNGKQRIIVTNHPQYSHNSIKDKIIDIIKNDDWSGSISGI